MNDFLYIMKKCKICNGKGYVFDQHLDYKGEKESNIAKECECLKKINLYRKYKNSNILPNYYGFDFSKDFITEGPVKKSILSIMKNLEEFKEMGYGLVLHGGKGTGKTMIGSEILKAAIRNGYSARYEFFPSIVETLADRDFKASDARRLSEANVANPDFLVLDELGKEFSGHKHFGKQDISRFLEINVLKKRSNKSTILISNLDEGLEGFKKEYGQFVVSVIKSKLKIINMEGMDFRDIEKGNVDKFMGEINGKS